VQCLPGKSDGGSDSTEVRIVGFGVCIGDGTVLHPLQKYLVGLSIEPIAEDRVADVIEMDANLVGSTCVQKAVNQRETLHLFHHSKACLGRESIPDHSAAQAYFALGLVPDGCIDGEIGPVGVPDYDGQILFAYGLGTMAELIFDPGIGCSVQSEDQHAAGVAIQAMAELDLWFGAAVSDQTDDSPLPPVACGVAEDARGLAHYEQSLVFVDGWGRRGGIASRGDSGNRDLQDLAGLEKA
jgi:hypothetical protein